MFLDWLISFCMVVLVVMSLVCVYRLIAGPSTADRLLAVDTIALMIVGLLGLYVLITDTSIYLHVALGLAAFSFVGTVAIARYLSERKIF